MKKSELLELMNTCELRSDVRGPVLTLVESRNTLEVIPEFDTAAEVGGSKLGGVPDFPAGNYAWPGQGERPMLFLAQLSLRELADQSGDSELPSEGHLYFFLFDEEYPAIPKVIYAPEGSSLSPAEIHDMLPTSEVPAPTKLAFQIREDVFLPRYDSERFNELNLGEEERYAFEDFEYDVEGDTSYNQAFQGSQILGDWDENAMSAWSGERNDINDWKVLLVLDPFQDEQWTQSALSKFSGLGRRLFFFIENRALERKDFSAVRVDFGES